MATKSHAESEAPAKVYQLDAVDEKVSSALKKLDAVLDQTKGVATLSDVASAKKDVEESSKTYTDDEITKVHLTYGPVKNNLTWFTRAVVGQGIILVFQLIGLAFVIIASIGK